MKQSPIATAIQVALDKPRTLILDFNAFVAYAEQTGTELPDDVAALFKRDEKGGLINDENGIPEQARQLTTKQLRAMIWAGVFHEDESLTVKDVGRYMGKLNHAQLQVAIFKSLMGIKDEPADPTSAEVAENPSPGIGSTSDPSANSSLELVTRKRSGR